MGHGTVVFRYSKAKPGSCRYVGKFGLYEEAEGKKGGWLES